MCVLELKPLLVKAFAAVKGLVGTFCFDSKTELFPGGAILVCHGTGYRFHRQSSHPKIAIQYETTFGI